MSKLCYWCEIPDRHTALTDLTNVKSFFLQKKLRQGKRTLPAQHEMTENQSKVIMT